MNNFEKTIHDAGDAKDYSLSASERTAMTRVLREYMAMKPLPGTQAGYSVTLSYRWFSFAHRPMAAALVLVLVFGTGVSYAAENALPGDALYTVKTYINEPAKVALATSAEAKAEVQIELAERRIEEAAVLAAEGRLDEQTEDDLAVAFESHAAAVAEHIRNADAADEGASIELASRFETRLAAHENILLEVEDADESEHSTRLAGAIRAASETVVTMGADLAVAQPIDTNADVALMAANETLAPDSGAASLTTEAAPMSLSMENASDAEAPTGARSAKMAMTLDTVAVAPVAAPDAKTISRMKAASEKSLKNAQKKFKDAKSLSADARASAETDLALAASLIEDGTALLAADADSDAYASFKESLRISESAAVYIKAAPTLEKARSRAKNIRGDVESRIESRGVDTSIEIGPINASVTLPDSTDSSAEEPDPSPGEPTTERNATESLNTNLNVKLDLSL